MLEGRRCVSVRGHYHREREDFSNLLCINGISVVSHETFWKIDPVLGSMQSLIRPQCSSSKSILRLTDHVGRRKILERLCQLVLETQQNT